MTMSECEGATPDTELAMSRDCTESPLSSGTEGGNFTPPPPSDPKFVAPRRPALGVEGRTISLRANHLEVSVRPGYIFQYRVNIMPGGCPRREGNGHGHLARPSIPRTFQDAPNDCCLAGEASRLAAMVSVPSQALHVLKTK